MNIFSAIGNAFKKLWNIITSPKAQRAIEEAIELVPLALPIVQDLRSVDPKSASVDDIKAIYWKYKIPVIESIGNTPMGIGNALLNLATLLLSAKAPGASTSLLQTAIQLALTALKAK
jgi:hypothetical protein